VYLDLIPDRDVDYTGGATLQMGRKPPHEHVRRLDQMIIHRDDDRGGVVIDGPLLITRTDCTCHIPGHLPRVGGAR
jgi:hypothetical protein